MRIYIGYILRDYSIPICMSLDKKTVEKELKNYEDVSGCKPWIHSYDLHKNLLIDLNND